MGVRATFKKRYITLAPVAGIVGLAFNLKVLLLQEEMAALFIFIFLFFYLLFVLFSYFEVIFLFLPLISFLFYLFLSRGKINFVRRAPQKSGE